MPAGARWGTTQRVRPRASGSTSLAALLPFSQNLCTKYRPNIIETDMHEDFYDRSRGTANQG